MAYRWLQLALKLNVIERSKAVIMTPEEKELFKRVSELEREAGFYRGLLEGVLSHDIDSGLKDRIAAALEMEDARKDN